MNDVRLDPPRNVADRVLSPDPRNERVLARLREAALSGRAPSGLQRATEQQQ